MTSQSFSLCRIKTNTNEQQSLDNQYSEALLPLPLEKKKSLWFLPSHSTSFFMKINSKAEDAGKRNVVPPNCCPCSGLHGSLGPVPTSAGAGDRLFCLPQHRPGLPASTAEAGPGGSGWFTLSASQQKLPVYA